MATALFCRAFFCYFSGMVLASLFLSRKCQNDYFPQGEFNSQKHLLPVNTIFWILSRFLNLQHPRHDGIFIPHDVARLRIRGDIRLVLSHYRIPENARKTWLHTLRLSWVNRWHSSYALNCWIFMPFCPPLLWYPVTSYESKKRH